WVCSDSQPQWVRNSSRVWNMMVVAERVGGRQSGVCGPDGFPGRVGRAGVKGARGLLVTHRLGIPDLGREEPQQAELLHHAKVVGRFAGLAVAHVTMLF